MDEDRDNSAGSFTLLEGSRGSRPHTSPTLIKGIGGPIPPGQKDPWQQRLFMIPLLCMGFLAVAGPWLIAGEQSPTTPLAAPATDAASETGTVALTVHVPANGWLDTGVEMCGCTRLSLTASGQWRTPRGENVGPEGRPVNHSAKSSIPYGALVARVGTGKPVLAGKNKLLLGEDFDDLGTLQLGMNAGRRAHGASGELVIAIRGTGLSEHAPRIIPR